MTISRMTISYTASRCLGTENSTAGGETGVPHCNVQHSSSCHRNELQVLTLLLTIILSRSLLMSANTGLLSGSCFQHCSIRLYLVGCRGGWLQSSKDHPAIPTHPVWCPGPLFPNPKAASVSLTFFSGRGQGLRGQQGFTSVWCCGPAVPAVVAEAEVPTLNTLMMSWGMNTNTCRSYPCPAPSSLP